MRVPTKVATGVLAIGLLPLVGTSPASAAAEGSDSASAAFSFERNGEPLHCHVEGTSNYRLPNSTRSSDTIIHAVTRVPDDPGCRDAIRQVAVDGYYETRPGSGTYRYFGAVAYDPVKGPSQIVAGTRAEGPVGVIDITHTVIFDCDGAHQDDCTLIVNTSPK